MEARVASIVSTSWRRHGWPDRAAVFWATFASTDGGALAAQRIRLPRVQP